MASDFFVLHTNPQRESFVVEILEDLEPYCPRFKNAKGNIRPLFPSYLFVPSTPHWGPLLHTVGVRGLLMSGEHPAVIAGNVISHWKGKERGGLVQLPPPPRFSKGQRLTIIRGSLAGRGVIYDGMAARDRERVLIDMLGAQVTLTVSAEDLVPERLPDAKSSLHKNREAFIRAATRTRDIAR
jgi:transcription antitermination factor NusG